MPIKVAVIGFGSIGRRHAGNLKELGCEVIPIDLNYKFNYDVDIAFICTPTQFHVEHAIEYIKRGIPVFIEKPLTYCLDEIDLIEKELALSPVPTMVGCNLRFHPSIIKAKGIADTKKVIFARAETGYYLPFWRQNDYKQSYSASEYGGIIIDAIHEPDYLQWLFGPIKDLKIVCDRVSNLEIQKEDIAEIAIMFNGVSASVHCDYLMKNYHRKLDLYMPHETVSFKIAPTNLMYKKEVEYFLSCIESKTQPMNGVTEAADVLRKVLQGGSYNSSPAHVKTATA